MTSEITKAIRQAVENAESQKPNNRGVQIGRATFPWYDHEGSVTVYQRHGQIRTTIVDGRTPLPVYTRGASTR